MGVKTFEELENEGKARFEGDRRPFDQLRRDSLMLAE